MDNKPIIIKRCTLGQSVTDWADVHSVKSRPAVDIAVRALNDNRKLANGGLDRDFYFLEVRTKGKVTIFVPYTGAKDEADPVDFVSIIQMSTRK